jgi:uncharacterized protein YndB with AHSA1/START domain
MKSFYYTSYIKTTPKELFAALTTTAFTERYWFGRQFKTDWQLGSKIEVLDDKGEVDWVGKVVAYEPYKKLAYTFRLECKPALKNDEPSLVTFKLELEGKATVKMTVLHEQLTQGAFDDVSEGWPAILSNLKSLLESGKSLEFESSGE